LLLINEFDSDAKRRRRKRERKVEQKLIEIHFEGVI